MGFELWYSQRTGVRRNGTSFKEIQELFTDKITVESIFEPLACCVVGDSAEEIKNRMNELGFDILGVSDNNKPIGYIIKEDLLEGQFEIENAPHKFNEQNSIPKTEAIAKIFQELTDKDAVFVKETGTNEIIGVLTKADINKPVVRLYIFGIISLFELHLNFWISHYCRDEIWQGILKKDRIEKAYKIYEERKGQNLDLTLLECVQIADKKEILRETKDFLMEFDFSKNKFAKLLRHMEKIRNEIAHSQNSITSNLSWSEFSNCLNKIKEFLLQSEKIIETQ